MSVKSRSLLAVAVGSMVLLGCAGDEDARLKELTAGISKDSALSVIGVRTGERPASYLVAGQMIEAIMIRREGVEGPLDSLTQKQYTPVVIIGGNLAGWGWKYWDSVSGANNIK